jgi:hypothetical protein
MSIDWNDPKCKISKHFTVKEATYLPSIGVLHIPSEEEKKNIIKFAEKMDKVRDIVNASITIHVWIRPISVNCIETKYKGFNYNEYIGSTAKKSAHIAGLACDFHAKGFEGRNGCDALRSILIPKLEELGLRMEDIPGDWIHLDMYPVINKRFFNPKG